MSETAEISREEVFDFPPFASLINHAHKTAYAMGLRRRIRESRVVDVAFKEAEQVVYEYQTCSNLLEAILLRSVWLRPTSPLDGARPLKIQVLVDHELMLDEDIDLHTRGSSFPFPRRSCSCNEWGHTGLDCKCPVTPLQRRPSICLFSAARVEKPTVDGALSFPDDQYGIFAPHGTLVQIKVVKGHSEPVNFQARCGITAALYSTSEERKSS